MNLGGGGCSKTRSCHCTLALATEGDFVSKKRKKKEKDRQTDRKREEGGREGGREGRKEGSEAKNAIVGGNRITQKVSYRQGASFNLAMEKESKQ